MALASTSSKVCRLMAWLRPRAHKFQNRCLMIPSVCELCSLQCHIRVSTNCHCSFTSSTSNFSQCSAWGRTASRHAVALRPLCCLLPDTWQQQWRATCHNVSSFRLRHYRIDSTWSVLLSLPSLPSALSLLAIILSVADTLIAPSDSTLSTTASIIAHVGQCVCIFQSTLSMYTS